MSSGIPSRCSLSVADPESRIQNLPFEMAASISPDRPSSSPEVAPGRRPPKKHCCLCWCCSCMRRRRFPEKRRADPKRQPNELVNLKKVQDETREPFSPSEVRQWGESFEKVMQSRNGRLVFREFLRSEFSEENILFWLACEDLKQEVSAQFIQEKTQQIYDDFISILSPKEVSLDSRVKKTLDCAKDHPSRDTYHEAQLQIYTLMQRDSYPRFINSSMYKELTKL